MTTGLEELRAYLKTHRPLLWADFSTKPRKHSRLVLNEVTGLNVMPFDEVRVAARRYLEALRAQDEQQLVSRSASGN